MTTNVIHVDFRYGMHNREKAKQILKLLELLKQFDTVDEEEHAIYTSKIKQYLSDTSDIRHG